MNFEDTVRMTSEWYSSYYKNPVAILPFTLSQIASYTNQAISRFAVAK